MANNVTSPGDEYYVEPIQRASQACENCRRKKSRCSGERPRCSVCTRLRQRCTYTEKVLPQEKRGRGRGPKSRSAFAAMRGQSESNRLSAVENRLCELAQALGSKGIVDISGGDELPPTNQTSSLESTSPLETFQTTPHEPDIPNEIREEGILLYFRHFHNQPYPLLTGMSENLQASASEYPKIVLFPLLAISLRTCQDSFIYSKEGIAETCGRLSEAAWKLLGAQYAKFEFDLPYFQGLCLLAQVDFATGKPRRAQAQVALGLRLAQTRGLLCKESAGSSEDHLSLGWRSVVWTLFMMDRIFSGATVRISVPASSFQLFLMQCSPPSPGGSSSPKETMLPVSPGDILRDGPLDVSSCVMVLLDIWQSALVDVFNEGSSAPVPFWRNDSAQAIIETRLMEFEMQAHRHRYVVVGSPRRILNEPHLRPFFSAWIFLQILYSATRCLLHHPFVLFMNTRHQQNQVPLTTLQKSHQQSMIHSSWVIRHIIEMEGAGMSVYEPFVGYLVAVAASVQLEHTLSDSPKIAHAARHKYDKAHAYLQKLAKIWPNVANILSVLNEISARLHRRRTISYGDGEYDGAIPSKDLSEVNVDQEDIDLMAKLFDYAALSDEKGGVSSDINAVAEATSTALSLVPQDNPSASGDSAVVEIRDIPPDPLAVPDEPDWTNEFFEISQTFANDWSFLGQLWATHFPDGSK